MLPDDSTKIGKNWNPFDKPYQFDWDMLGNVATYASDALLGTNFIGNQTNMQIANQNLDFQKEYLKKNEELLREAWSREDDAVQRRVADLKAAGLSPTLAAGSAAATSGPIQLKAPQNEFQYQNPFGGGILNALANVLSLKNADLQNQLLQKQVDTYGEPAWYKGLVAVLDHFNRDGGPLIQNVVNGMENALDAAGVEHGKIDFTPKYGFTFAKPPTNVIVSNEKEEAIIRSLPNEATVTKSTSEGTMVTFDSAKAARDWYLSIGGTTYEWYVGVRKYGSPTEFIKHIIQTGGVYF